MTTKHHDQVPDNHRCYNCNRNKHEGVNFFVDIRKSGITYVRPQCNSCKEKGLKFKRKYLPKPIKRSRKELISLEFTKYFLNKNYNLENVKIDRNKRKSR